MTAFAVDRTRGRNREEQPCSGAYRGKARAVDQRTVASGIYLEYDAWLIDLATLDHLVAFLREHGRCVLDAEEGATPTIEIYDYYRE